MLRKLRNLAYLRKQAWLPKEVILARQEERLRQMVAYAYNTIPYYREVYKNLGLEDNPILNKKDLERLPIITKKDIQKWPQNFLRPGIDVSKCLEMHTSGSTGMPLKIYYGSEDDDYSKVNNLRSFLEAGYRAGHAFVIISDPDWVKNRYQANDLVSLQRKLNLFYPIDVNIRKSPSDIVNDILAIGKCDVLYGYPTSIFLVAQEIERRGETRIQPKIVVTNGELLETRIRDYIDRVFSVRLLDFYTTEEFKRIAWECEAHEGYHMDAESVVIEFVKEGRQVEKGDRGEIIMTNLFNRTMPLISYRQGDIGAESTKSCSCGRGLPLMESIEGRTDSFIMNRKKEMFSPQIFWSIFRHYFSIRNYQIRQDALEEITVLYSPIPEALSLESDLEEIKGKITESLGDDMRIVFQQTENFGKGKRKSVYTSLIISLYD